MTRVFLLISCCLLSSGCVPALVTKSPGAYGRVTDGVTGAPIARASVSFPERSPTVLTDKNGQYNLPHTTKLGIIVFLPVEFQTLPLQVSRPGYQTATVGVRTIYNHELQDVVLKPQP